MSVLADVLKVYGAICLGVVLILGGALLTLTIGDWIADRFARARDRECSRFAASESALIDQLEAIPTPGPWEMS